MKRLARSFRIFLNPRGALFATQGLSDQVGRNQKSVAGLDLKIKENEFITLNKFKLINEW